MTAEEFQKGALSLGVDIDEKGLHLFDVFSSELKKWGAKMNLSALLEKEEKIREELFLDSLAPLPFLSGAVTLLDIGSGAGFPGIPLKIAAPAISMVLADSLEKRTLFQRHVIRTLGLEKIEARHLRFSPEEASGLEKDVFDAAIAKAVADTKLLGQWARPHLKIGGRLFAMKGPSEEAPELEGYEGPQIETYTLPFSGHKRYLYIYTKK